LQHRIGNGSQKIALTALLQQLDKRHSVIGARTLCANSLLNTSYATSAVGLGWIFKTLLKHDR
jgi:hypothetical protein